jgi:hypothetical protein
LGGKFKFPKKVLFAAMNFKKIKDDYREKFAKISEKVQSRVAYFVEIMADNMSPLFF